MFKRCSQIITDEPFNIRSAILQSVSECHERRIKVNRPISPILTLKLVAMTTSYERSGKERIKSVIYDQMPTTMVKIW